MKSIPFLAPGGVVISVKMKTAPSYPPLILPLCRSLRPARERAVVRLLWRKPIRQILEERSRGAAAPSCQERSTVSYKYISHAGLEHALNYIISPPLELMQRRADCVVGYGRKMAPGLRENASLDLLISSVIVSQPMWG